MFKIDSLSTAQKRDLVKQLRESIAIDRTVARSAKILARADKAQARADKKADRIAKLQAKLDALMNPVGAKAIKANKKASAVTIIKA
jgi:hypothetical protein